MGRTSWSGVGGGVTGTTGGSTAVTALVFDGGGNLYVGGSFTEAGAVTVNSIARWDGAASAGLGSGVVNGRVETLVIAFPYLYAGGGFSDMDGNQTLDFIAKWEGVVMTPNEDAAPTDYARLAPAFPNPFRTEATLAFSLRVLRPCGSTCSTCSGGGSPCCTRGRPLPGSPSRHAWTDARSRPESTLRGSPATASASHAGSRSSAKLFSTRMSDQDLQPSTPRRLSPEMPVGMTSQFTDEEEVALWAYLRTLPPAHKPTA